MACKVRIKNQMNGARRVRLDPRTQDVPYDAVHFGFNKLKEAGGLAPEVLRQLRSLNLIEGTVRRN
jgi:hypothetical protein